MWHVLVVEWIWVYQKLIWEQGMIVAIILDCLLTWGTSCLIPFPSHVVQLLIPLLSTLWFVCYLRLYPMECAATSMCISDINVAIVNFSHLVLSTHELFACFCTHCTHHVLERSMEHTHKPSLFSFSSIFWTRQTISSFGVTYTCGFQSSSCSKRL